MDLQKLFEMQAKLDKKIVEEKGLQGQDLLDKKILALQVELGELANELPEVFKFWSSKKNNYEKALWEYCDCLHFILSIAIELGYIVDDLYVSDNELVGKTEDIFLELMYWVIHIKSTDKQKRKKAFRIVCYIFFNMAEQRLGFTWEQIEESYFEKNRINHERQNSGY